MAKQVNTFDITGEVVEKPERYEDGTDVLIRVTRHGHEDVFDVQAIGDAESALAIAEAGDCVRVRGSLAAEQVETEDGKTINRLRLVADRPTHLYGPAVLDDPAHEAICDVMGNAGNEPKTSTTSQGSTFTKFSVAVSHRSQKDGQRVENTVWHNITGWGEGPAERIAKIVKHGARISTKCHMRSSEQYGPQLTLATLWGRQEQTREFDITGILADDAQTGEHGAVAVIDVARAGRDGKPYEVDGQKVFDTYTVHAEQDAAAILGHGKAGEAVRVYGQFEPDVMERDGKEVNTLRLVSRYGAFVFGEPVLDKNPPAEAVARIAGYAGKDAQQLSGGKRDGAKLAIGVNRRKDEEALWFHPAYFGGYVDDMMARAKKGTHLHVECAMTNSPEYGPDFRVQRFWATPPSAKQQQQSRPQDGDAPATQRAQGTRRGPSPRPARLSAAALGLLDPQAVRAAPGSQRRPCFCQGRTLLFFAISRRTASLRSSSFIQLNSATTFSSAGLCCQRTTCSTFFAKLHSMAGTKRRCRNHRQASALADSTAGGTSKDGQDEPPKDSAISAMERTARSSNPSSRRMARTKIPACGVAA